MSIIKAEYWSRINPSRFEQLAYEHVKDIYPGYLWVLTKQTGDGGKDAHGSFQDLEKGLNEIYWMEAKHHYKDRSIGHYTLDTHLLSAFLSSDKVSKLHVVTSGSFSAKFLIRAHAFASKNNFTFSYSDETTLVHWLNLRHDLISKYFLTQGNQVKNTIESFCLDHPDSKQFICQANIIRDNKLFEGISDPTNMIVPGLRYCLVIMVATSVVISKNKFPIRIKWVPDSKLVHILHPEASSSDGIMWDSFPEVSCFVLSFSITKYIQGKLPNPTMIFGDHSEIEIPLAKNSIVQCLSSPFVGKLHRDLLIRIKRLFERKLYQNTPLFVLLKGKAGCGKSRIVEELLDDVQINGGQGRILRFSSRDSKVHVQEWKKFLLWVLGGEYNPFSFDKEKYLEEVISSLFIEKKKGVDHDFQLFKQQLFDFLINGDFSPHLFDYNEKSGKWMADLVSKSLSNRVNFPVVFHLEDIHNLEGDCLSPLYFIKHIVDSRDNLSFAFMASCRTDQITDKRAVELFINTVEATENDRIRSEFVPDFTKADAHEFIKQTLQWPELRSEDSKLLDLITHRAGLNAFSLTQILHHICIDKQSVEFLSEDRSYLTDPSKLKEALTEIPDQIFDLMKIRFKNLTDHGKSRIVQIMAAIAIFGRQTKISNVNLALRRALQESEIIEMIQYGYLISLDSDHVALSHDLLVESLLVLAKQEVLNAAQITVSKLDQKIILDLGNYLSSVIFYYAGPSFYPRSYEFALSFIKAESAKQNYQVLKKAFDLLEKITLKDSTKFRLSDDILLIAGYAEQHCGNTMNALNLFLVLRERSLKRIDQFDCFLTYLKASTEAANQHYLRVEPTLAHQLCQNVIELCSNQDLFSARPVDIFPSLSLAHNRVGAVFHLVENQDKALDHFKKALDIARLGDDIYLYAHTLLDIGKLLRFTRKTDSADYIAECRMILNKQLKHKERLRIMLETSERYSICLVDNTVSNRAYLNSIAFEALEKGYVFQATSGFLSFAYCSILASEFEIAYKSILRVLDIAVIAEDNRTRLFGYHYLSYCAFHKKEIIKSLDFSLLAQHSGVNDQMFYQTEISRTISNNVEVTNNLNTKPELQKNIDSIFKLYPFNRS